MTNKPEPVATSFRCPWELYKRFIASTPNYGDRSRVLRALIEKYLDGEIVIQIQPKGVKPHADDEMLVL